MTAEKIVRYCRSLRYENLVYNNQPAARETGLPGIIAPPAMVFLYAPARIRALLLGLGSTDPANSPGESAAEPLGSPVKIQLNFQGILVQPEDTITSVTTVQDKLESGPDRQLVARVTAHNQQGQLVAEYFSAYNWGQRG